MNNNNPFKLYVTVFFFFQKNPFISSHQFQLLMLQFSKKSFGVERGDICFHLKTPSSLHLCIISTAEAEGEVRVQ